MAKLTITTDAPGCRDTVRWGDGVPVLVERCGRSGGQDAGDDRNGPRRTAGDGSARPRKEKMMREFDERIVINRYLDVVGEIAKAR